MLDELVPEACHAMEQYANNPIEADHGMSARFAGWPQHPAQGRDTVLGTHTSTAGSVSAPPLVMRREGATDTSRSRFAE